MNRLYLFLLLISICSLSSNAQTEKQNGYIISLSGDTIKGILIADDNTLSTNTIRFTATNENSYKEYSSNDINGYGAFGVSDFLSFDVDIETSSNQTSELDDEPKIKTEKRRLFLRRIYSGKINLYTHTTANAKMHFFTSAGDTLPVELIYKKYILKKEFQSSTSMNTDYAIAYNRKYKNQLTLLMKDCASISSKINNTEYTQKDMLKLFEFYSTCIGQIGVQNIPKTKSKISVKLFAGMKIYKLQFQGEGNIYNLSETDFGSDFSPQGGISLSIPLQKNFNRYIAGVNLGYNSMNSEGKSVSHGVNFLGDEFKYYSYKIKHHSIKLDLFFRYRILPQAKFPVDLFIGGAFDYVVSRDYYYNYFVDDFRGYYLGFEGELFDQTRKDSQFIFGGAGIKLSEKFYFELSYEKGNAMVDYSSMSGGTRGCRALLFYTLQ